MYYIWYANRSCIRNIGPEFCVRGCDIVKPARAISHPIIYNYIYYIYNRLL